LFDLFFNETINRERYVHVIFGQFFPELTEVDSMVGFTKTPSGTELSAVVFDQHVHPILILVIFSSGVV
jgi:hypothetical protein